jgi:ATP-dependent DNA ligase
MPPGSRFGTVDTFAGPREALDLAPVPNKLALPKQAAGFIETMDCLPVSKLPEGPKWTYEIKLDGYRLEVVRHGREITLYSRRQNVFNQKFPYIATALKGLPGDTVIDGELVALGPDGRPDFNLRNFRSAESRIHYYAFDILIHQGQRLTELPLSERRAVLSTVIKPSEHVALSQVSDRSAADLKFVKDHGLEGVVAKRADSFYQPGQRTGLWSKYRINLGQEFVIGGYVPSHLGVDSLVVGFYPGKDLIYAARVRAGLVPATRREVFDRIKLLKTPRGPFANLLEPSALKKVATAGSGTMSLPVLSSSQEHQAWANFGGCLPWCKWDGPLHDDHSQLPAKPFCSATEGPSRPRSPMNIFALLSPILPHMSRYDRPSHWVFMTFFHRAGW